MKKEENIPHKFESLCDLHRVFGLPAPLHPLISLVENKDNEIDGWKLPVSFIANFYKISYKKNLSGKLKYGQGYYDFDEGGLLFAAPNQIIGKKSKITNLHPNYLIFNHSYHPNVSWYDLHPNENVEIEWLKDFNGTIIKSSSSTIWCSVATNNKGTELKIGSVSNPLDEDGK